MAFAKPRSAHGSSSFPNTLINEVDEEEDEICTAMDNFEASRDGSVVAEEARGRNAFTCTFQSRDLEMASFLFLRAAACAAR